MWGNATKSNSWYLMEAAFIPRQRSGWSPWLPRARQEVVDGMMTWRSFAWTRILKMRVLVAMHSNKVAIATAHQP